MQISIPHFHKVRFMSLKNKNEFVSAKTIVAIHCNSICNTQIDIYSDSDLFSLFPIYKYEINHDAIFCWDQ